ncbi:hypothetical protein Syun_020073 [Stephania yunnanensis]|uniref:Uncharacterized protein n=1 Tax=Stephania yunnanensis TaxID=152371 RepID=A0AAP0NZZ6_9MAGN
MVDGFSTVDGFMDVNQGLAEMIKYAANEPSVGLYYIQHHTHAAVPNLLHLNHKVVAKSHETTLHTQDLEDSITMLKSMKQCGLSIVDPMIDDISKSLLLISPSQPQRGLIQEKNSRLEIGRSSSWGPTAFGQNITNQDGAGSVTYLSTILKTAKERAASIRWPQLDAKQSSTKQPANAQFHNMPTNTVLDMPDKDAEELPLSSQITEDQIVGSVPVDGDRLVQDLLPLRENYEVFKAVKEAKMEKWLEE